MVSIHAVLLLTGHLLDPAEGAQVPGGGRLLEQLQDRKTGEGEDNAIPRGDDLILFGSNGGGGIRTPHFFESAGNEPLHLTNRGNLQVDQTAGLQMTESFSSGSKRRFTEETQPKETLTL